MKEITKDELLKKFPENTSCRVWYKGQKNPIAYSSLKHVNWKQVNKITLLFEKDKIVFDDTASEYVSRDGTAFLLK